jgi:hypothetical protein
MIKAHATDVHVSKDIHTFMHQLEKKTKIMTNFLLVDSQISKYKPSVLAAALIFAAFTLEFEQQRSKWDPKDTRFRPFLTQISQVYQTWRFTVALKVLRLYEVDQVQKFAFVLVKRMCLMHREQHEYLPNIYPENTAVWLTDDKPESPSSATVFEGYEESSEGVV